MEIRLVKFGLRLYSRFVFQIKKVQHVTGVNSQYQPETHFLMWDFDDIPLPVVIQSLRSVQKAFSLPAISILETKENGYHAYCFRACSFLEARGIISFTPNVDRHYIAAGVGRGYFTLRFTDFNGRGFHHVTTLKSDIPADLDYSDINCFVEYTKAVK